MGSCYNADKEKETDVWKSFDESTYNFHIVPNERKKKTVADVQQKIKRKAQGIGGSWVAKGDYCRWWHEGSDIGYLCDINGNVVSTEYLPE